MAIKKKNSKIVEALLDAKADTTVVDKNGRNLLHWLMRSPAKQLKSDRRTNREHLRYWKNQRKVIAEKLISAGTPVNGEDNQGNRPLHLASMSTDLSIIELLVNKGADINAKNHQGYTSLHYALKNKRADITRFLIDKKIDLAPENFDCDEAMRLATIAGDTYAIQALQSAASQRTPNSFA